MADYKHFVKENRLVVNVAWILALVLLFLWAVNFFNISYPLTVTSKTSSGDLAVVGVGKVDTTPDTASVDRTDRVERIILIQPACQIQE